MTSFVSDESEFVIGESKDDQSPPRSSDASPIQAGMQVEFKGLQETLEFFQRESRADKVLLLLAAPTGSGKSTLYDEVSLHFSEMFPFVRGDVATINSRIYTKGETRDGSRSKYKREIRGEHLQRASELGESIIYDTRMNKPADVVKDINSMKEKGYTVVLLSPSVDVQDAVSRISKRDHARGKEVDVQRIFEEHHAFPTSYKDVSRQVDLSILMQNKTLSQNSILMEVHEVGGTFVCPNTNIAESGSVKIDFENSLTSGRC